MTGCTSLSRHCQKLWGNQSPAASPTSSPISSVSLIPFLPHWMPTEMNMFSPKGLLYSLFFVLWFSFPERELTGIIPPFQPVRGQMTSSERWSQTPLCKVALHPTHTAMLHPIHILEYLASPDLMYLCTLYANVSLPEKKLYDGRVCFLFSCISSDWKTDNRYLVNVDWKGSNLTEPGISHLKLPQLILTSKRCGPEKRSPINPYSLKDKQSQI